VWSVGALTEDRIAGLAAEKCSELGDEKTTARAGEHRPEKLKSASSDSAIFDRISPV
jgi:hypothetical protein